MPDQANQATLVARLSDIRGELARADSKSAALLGVAGAALTVLLAAASLRPPTPALVLGGAAVLADTAAIAILTWALLPRLRRAGWLAYADMPPAAAATHAAAGDDDAEQLVVLSQLGRAKFRLIQAAVVSLLAVVVLSIAAAAAAVAGA